MAVTTDILAAWRGPARFLRAKRAEGVSEPQILVLMLLACFLIFVARWPALSRSVELARQTGGPDAPGLQAILGVTFFATMFMLPLVLYILAGLSHLVARPFGGAGSFQSARLALVWALLAVSPATLFHGLAEGLIGPGPTVTGVGLLTGAAFLWLWIAMLMAAES